MNQGTLNTKTANLHNKIEEQARDLHECRRVRADQRLVVEGLFRQNEALRLEKKNAEDSVRLHYTQCKAAQSDLTSVIAILNSEFDMAYLLWSTTPNDTLAARMEALGDILGSLGMFDKFNKPRWQQTQESLDRPG